MLCCVNLYYIVFIIKWDWKFNKNVGIKSNCIHFSANSLFQIIISKSVTLLMIVHLYECVGDAWLTLMTRMVDENKGCPPFVWTYIYMKKHTIIFRYITVNYFVFFFKFDQSLEILLSLLLLLYLTFLKKFYVLLTSSPATKDNTFDKCMKKETKKLITSWKIHDTHSKISFFLYYDYFTLL